MVKGCKLKSLKEQLKVHMNEERSERMKVRYEEYEKGGRSGNAVRMEEEEEEASSCSSSSSSEEEEKEEEDDIEEKAISQIEKVRLFRCFV